MKKIRNTIVSVATAAGLAVTQFSGLLPVSLNVFAASAISTDTIAVGENHSLVIKSDMSLWAAGSNSCGQLGVGNSTESSTGSKVLSNVVFVDANDNSSFAIDSKGTLYGWGDNTDGQVAPGNNSVYIYTPVEIMKNVVSVSAGDTHTVAVTSDGKVYGWGSNDYGELGKNPNAVKNPVTEMKSDVKDAAAGNGFTIITDKNGKVYACGKNDSGQLGTGGVRNCTTLTETISGAEAVEAGNSHSLVLKSDGTVWAAGLNDYGQVGNRSTGTSVTTYTSLGLKSIAAVFAGGNSSGAVSTGGALYTWGENDSGQLHNGSMENEDEPSSVTSNVVSIAFGEHHSIMLKNNNQVSASGIGSSGELFSESTGVSLKPEKVLKDVSAYSAGADHSAAVTDDGTLYTWGNNDCGQLGLGNYNSTSRPTKVKLNDYAVDVWCGNKITFVLTEGNEIYAFGDNSDGLLGMRTKTTKVNTPTRNLDLSDYSNVEDIKCSDGYCLALIDGTVYGWGRNTSSRLADCGSKVTSPTIISSALDNIDQIAAGSTHCLALDSSGTLWGWGSNSSYQLGTTTEGRVVEYPQALEITQRERDPDDKKHYIDVPIGIKSIAASGNHTIAINENDRVMVWGSNSNGQLGTDTSRIRSATELYYEATDVFAGNYACGIIDRFGDVCLSGSNKNGALGDGTNKDRASFDLVTASDAVSLSIGDYFGGYINYSQELYCWGDNTYGQTGGAGGGMSDNPETVINDAACLSLKQPESIKLNKSDVTIKPYGTVKLTATISPSDAAVTAITWSSSNTAVATVSADGTVQAVGNGSAIITAKTQNNLTASCTVKVNIQVTSFTVSPSKSKTLNLGKSFTIKTKVYPADATDKTLTFESSDPEIASVDESGKVTAGDISGIAQITVTSLSNPAKTRVITVKVRPSKPVIASRSSTKYGTKIKWEEVNGSPTGYIIYRRSTASGKSAEIARVDSSTFEFIDDTVVKGNPYYYSVKAFTESDDGSTVLSASSKVYKVTTKYDPVPAE